MTETRFLVFADSRFLGRASKELRAIFEMDGYKKFSLDYDRAFIAAIGLEPSSVIEKMGRMKPVFVEGIVPIEAEAGYSAGSFDEIVAAAAELLDKGKRFRIEVKKIIPNFEGSAKAIEVLLGRKLEEIGFRADLKDPDDIVYVVLSDKAFIGRVSRKLAYSKVIDAFRHANKEAGSAISRAEFKLAEAIDFFEIDINEMKLCLDLGAAPGGWSALMMRSGSQVIAIDNADLDYEMLSKLGRVEITDAKVSAPEEWNLLHIKANVRDVSPKSLDWVGDVDALLVDMNIEAKESAAIAERFAPLLRSRGILILTIKLVDNNIDAHIGNAKAALKSFNDVRIKKLPHNRWELTLFARKI
ncbi:MAG: hypothetical protein KGH60_03725 [Candidatus Micrarchaeota archaeon]|nr:hypothetical protein [Candidatus Micrarchaeota archaeon]